MNLKSKMESLIADLDKGLANEMMLSALLENMIREDVKTNNDIIDQIKESDDNLIQAVCSFLRWKLNDDFSDAEDFFSHLYSAMREYVRYEDLGSKLLENFHQQKNSI